jgi:hypothetical protein
MARSSKHRSLRTRALLRAAEKGFKDDFAPRFPPAYSSDENDGANLALEGSLDAAA